MSQGRVVRIGGASGFWGDSSVGAPHLVQGEVTRHDVPGIAAFNFVCEQALGGGGMASLRNDPLGKGMAQILLALPVRAPKAWLAEEKTI